jgi:hypothetical protein
MYELVRWERHYRRFIYSPHTVIDNRSSEIIPILLRHGSELGSNPDHRGGKPADNCMILLFLMVYKCTLPKYGTVCRTENLWNRNVGFMSTAQTSVYEDYIKTTRSFP